MEFANTLKILTILLPLLHNLEARGNGSHMPASLLIHLPKVLNSVEQGLAQSIIGC